MPESDRTRAAHLQLLAVSWNFGWPIAAGVALGYWIDGKLGSSPAATLFIGIGAMAASTWRLLQLSRQEQVARHADEEEQAARDAAGKAGNAGPADALPSAPSRGLPGGDLRWDPETEQWVEDDSEWPAEGSGWADDEDSKGGTR